MKKIHCLTIKPDQVTLFFTDMSFETHLRDQTIDVIRGKTLITIPMEDVEVNDIIYGYEEINQE